MALTRVLRAQAGGHSFEVRSDDPAALAGLVARWRHLPRWGEGADEIYDLLFRPRPARLVRNGRSLATERRGELLGARFEAALYRSLVLQSPALPIHAAALSWGRGAALLLGPSGAGKSRLAWTLCARGAAYLGEEHAFVHEDLSLSGFPRALGFEAEGEPRLAWPERVLARAPRVGLLVFLAPEGRSPAEEALESAEACARLAAALHRIPDARDLARVALLCGSARGVVLARRPLSELAARVEAWGAASGLREEA